MLLEYGARLEVAFEMVEAVLKAELKGMLGVLASSELMVELGEW